MYGNWLTIVNILTSRDGIQSISSCFHNCLRVIASVGFKKSGMGSRAPAPQTCICYTHKTYIKTTKTSSDWGPV